MNPNENTRKRIFRGITKLLNENYSDEYYTTDYLVRLHFQLIDKLIKKHNISVFVLPCDDENSEYVKFLSDKECKLIYFKDMYNLERYPNIDKSQFLVITNPPFSNLTKWENWLNNNGFNFSILTGMTKNFDRRKSYYDTYLHNQRFILPNGGSKIQQVYITNNLSFGQADYLPNHFDFNLTEKRQAIGRKHYKGKVSGIPYYTSYNGLYCEPIGSDLFVPFGGFLIALENQNYIRIHKENYNNLPEFLHTWKRARITVLKHYDNCESQDIQGISGLSD